MRSFARARRWSLAPTRRSGRGDRRVSAGGNVEAWKREWRPLDDSSCLPAVLAAAACARAPAPDALLRRAAVVPAALVQRASQGSKGSKGSQGRRGPPSASDAAVDAAGDAAATAARRLAGPAERRGLPAASAHPLPRGGLRPVGRRPARFDAAVVARHCDELERAYADYRKAGSTSREPFLAALRPKDLPAHVVYPFGGGDLVTRAGDVPRRDRDHDHLARARGRHPARRQARARPPRARARGCTASTSSASSRRRTRAPTTSRRRPRRSSRARSSSRSRRSWSHGDEPVSLRYFRLRPDGVARST